MKLDLNRTLILTGALLLLYALLGNYIALPGYLRFLDRGGTSAAGNTLDADVIIGATKTILWMYSFQLGVLLLAIAKARMSGLHARHITIIGLVWLTLWSWPSLPAPGPLFYVIFGSVLLCLITLAILGRLIVTDERTAHSMFLGSMVFFAFATWEICGLGSTGRMLHPEEAIAPIPHNLLVTQSSKLMIEFVIAWGLLAAGLGRFYHLTFISPNSLNPGPSSDTGKTRSSEVIRT